MIRLVLYIGHLAPQKHQHNMPNLLFAHGMQVEVPEGTVLCFNPSSLPSDEFACYVQGAIPYRWYHLKT